MRRLFNLGAALCALVFSAPAHASDPAVISARSTGCLVTLARAGELLGRLEQYPMDPDLALNWLILWGYDALEYSKERELGRYGRFLVERGDKPFLRMSAYPNEALPMPAGAGMVVEKIPPIWDRLTPGQRLDTARALYETLNLAISYHDPEFPPYLGHAQKQALLAEGKTESEIRAIEASYRRRSQEINQRPVAPFEYAPKGAIAFSPLILFYEAVMGNGMPRSLVERYGILGDIHASLLLELGIPPEHLTLAHCKTCNRISFSVFIKTESNSLWYDTHNGFTGGDPKDVGIATFDRERYWIATMVDQ